MKKVVIGVLTVLAMVGIVSAGTVTASVTITNGQSITFSEPINVSGILDKIEISHSGTSTSTVTIATYVGTTALETFASLTTHYGTKVIRPRVLPTDNTGASLAAVVGGGATSNVTTVLTVPYSRPTIGGNVKMAVTSSGSGGADTVTATFYYDKAPIVAW